MPGVIRGDELVRCEVNRVPVRVCEGLVQCELMKPQLSFKAVLAKNPIKPKAERMHI